MGVIGLHSHFAMRKPKKQNKTKQNKNEKRKRNESNKMRWEWWKWTFAGMETSGLAILSLVVISRGSFGRENVKGRCSLSSERSSDPQYQSQRHSYLNPTQSLLISILQLLHHFISLKLGLGLGLPVVWVPRLSLFPRLKPSENWKPKTNPLFFFFFFPFSTFLANLKKWIIC